MAQHRGRSSRRGQGSVEFALALIVVMTLTMGIVDFARAFFMQQTLQTAAANGARRASVCQISDTASPPTNTKSVQYAVLQSLMNLGWTGTTVTIAYETGSATVGRQVTVTVTHTYDPATPIVGPIMRGVLGASPTLTGKTTSTVEQQSTTC